MNFYLFKDNRQMGPYTKEELNAFLKQGLVAENDLVWANDWPSWIAIGNVPGLVLNNVAPARLSAIQAVHPVENGTVVEPVVSLPLGQEFDSPSKANSQPSLGPTMAVVVVLSLGALVLVILISFPNIGKAGLFMVIVAGAAREVYNRVTGASSKKLVSFKRLGYAALILFVIGPGLGLIIWTVCFACGWLPQGK